VAVTVAVPEPPRAPCQEALPVAPLGIHTTDPGELQVRVTGAFTEALVRLAEIVVGARTLTCVVAEIAWAPLPQVIV
jgi:hypothetical protein